MERQEERDGINPITCFLSALILHTMLVLEIRVKLFRKQSFGTICEKEVIRRKA